jgi:hypothetical protein
MDEEVRGLHELLLQSSTELDDVIKKIVNKTYYID